MPINDIRAFSTNTIEVSVRDIGMIRKERGKRKEEREKNQHPASDVFLT
jgi:hypothetical protein